MKKVFFTIWIKVLFLLPFLTTAQGSVLVFSKSERLTSKELASAISVVTDYGKETGLWTVSVLHDNSVFTPLGLSEYDVVLLENDPSHSKITTVGQKALAQFVGQGGGLIKLIDFKSTAGNIASFKTRLTKQVKLAGNFVVDKRTAMDAQLASGVYYIRATGSNDFVLETSLEKGYNVYTGHFKQNEAKQVWYFEKQQNGLFKIKNMHNGRYLDFSGFSCSTNANVRTWQANVGFSNQYFRITKNNNGSNTLVPASCEQLAVSRYQNAATSNVKMSILASAGEATYWRIDPAHLTTNTAYKQSTQSAGAGSNVAIFPNPVRSIFSIAGLKNEHSIIITDVQGKVLHTSKVSPSQSIIDISKFKEGIYFLISADKSIYQRVVKI